MDSPTEYTLLYDQEKSLVPLDKVGTSADYIKTFKELSSIIEPVVSSFNAHPHFPTSIEFRTTEAISAPALIGVWATAPFLHNQSVPTVYHVLNSRDRPTRWRLSEDRYAYDYENLGVEFTIPDKADVTDLYIYDTTVRHAGTSNKGHTYGDKLSDKERYSIIEFLKTLGTDNVKPQTRR